MFFGLSNALDSFQGYIIKILAEKLNVSVIVYLDNILISIEETCQPHVEVLSWVFDKLQKHGLFANLKKYSFYQDKVQFFDYIVSAQEIWIEEERIEVVKAWPEP